MLRHKVVIYLHPDLADRFKNLGLQIFASLKARVIDPSFTVTPQVEFSVFPELLLDLNDSVVTI